MKMAAAACNGDDVQDRIEESIAQDSADGNDSCYFSESLIFLVFCGCSRVQNHQAPKGLWTASKDFKLHAYHRTLWAHLFPSTSCTEGDMCGSMNMCDGPHAGFPRRAMLAAPKGGRPYIEATPIGAAPTSPPEGVLLSIGHMELDELLARTTGRPGYIGPTLLR